MGYPGLFITEPEHDMFFLDGNEGLRFQRTSELHKAHISNPAWRLIALSVDSARMYSRFITVEMKKRGLDQERKNPRMMKVDATNIS